MDVLSDILALDRAPRAAVLAREDYRGPWAIRLGQRSEAGLHYVERGGCWLTPDGLRPTELRQGDMALLPLGAPHVLGDRPRRRAVDLADWLAAPPAPSAAPVNARILCAARPLPRATQPLHPLLHALPPLVHIPADVVSRCPDLGPCRALLLRELEREAQGRSAIVSLVLEAVLVFAVRHWVESQPTPTGWVGALRDRGVARALAAIHRAPAEPWTVARLAKEAGVARPTLARRFRATVGEGPSAYLTRVRMTRAAAALTATDRTLAEIAVEVGYTSEFALSRAFKRTLGTSPASFRRDAAQHAPNTARSGRSSVMTSPR